MEVKEGYMPFMGYSTYYRIIGECKNGTKPLICLHGGPGGTHDAFEIFDSLAKDRMIISYDQIGGGKSYIEGHEELFNADTWKKELMALKEYLGIHECHILGQSWGGMLAIIYISDEHPEDVKSCILSSTLSSSKLWSDELHNEIDHFEEEVKQAIYEAEQKNDYTSENYLKANARIMSIFSSASQKDNAPEFLKRKRVFGALAYNTAWGPNEYTPLGNLKDYDYTEKLDNWTIPALVVSGTNDLCRPLVAKTMADHIPNAKWELMAKCRHSCYLDDSQKYLKMLEEWLYEHD